MSRPVAIVCARSRDPYVLRVEPLAVGIPSGDVVSVSGVFAIDSSTNDTLDHEREFLVTRTAKPGDDTLSIYPGIRARGRYRSVSASPKPPCLVNAR